MAAARRRRAAPAYKTKSLSYGRGAYPSLALLLQAASGVPPGLFKSIRFQRHRVQGPGDGAKRRPQAPVFIGVIGAGRARVDLPEPDFSQA